MTTSEFVVEKEEIENGIRLILKGHVNAINAEALEYEMEEAISNGYKAIVLNMTQVEFLSSSGIRVILKTYKKMSKTGGKFNVERPSQNVRNVLGITALDTLLLK